MSASLRKLPSLKRVTGMAFMACMASLVGEHRYRRCCMDSLYKLESLTEVKYQGHRQYASIISVSTATLICLRHVQQHSCRNSLI